MKTVVYQSFRTTRVPSWIAACMESVRAWAKANGYDYNFTDDSFLELAPGWYRERCAGEICPLTDLCRLLLARQLLASGYERVIWIDADMLVFDPQALRVELPRGFAFCLELWPRLDDQGQLQCDTRANNSITAFLKGNVHLEFFIDSALRIAASKEQVGKLAISTSFLTGLAHLMPMPLLRNVGIFSPMLVHDIASGSGQHLKSYAACLPAPLAAANLCQSLVGPGSSDRAGQGDVDAVVEICLRTRGDVVNRHVGVGEQGTATTA